MSAGPSTTEADDIIASIPVDAGSASHKPTEEEDEAFLTMRRGRHKGAEKHSNTASDFVKSLVFGGLDGIVTTFASVAALTGGSLPIPVVLSLGFANLIAEAISMGMGDFVSSQAEFNHQVAERKREAWEFENYPEGEIEEMIDHLVSRGFEKGDATEIIQIIGQKQHKDFFVDFMMIEELGLEIPDDPRGPMKEGLVTFGSFLAFGSVPMWVYVIVFGAGYKNQGGTFGIACAATAITMFGLGILQGWLTKQNKIKAGIYMLLNGAFATVCAYLVGWGLESAIGNGC